MTKTNRPLIERSVPLVDIEIERGGDGRTVTAYAATFDTPYEVNDFDGHYEETINRAAFNRTLSHGIESIRSIFNHGKTLWGTPSERYSMPLGTPLEIVADVKGLKTVTRYAKTELADEVLELIREGSLKSFSFRGGIYGSAKPRQGPNGLPIIERTELGLKEYGPAVFAANDTAAILTLRAEDLIANIKELSPDERAELVRLLQSDTLEAPSQDTDTQTQPEETHSDSPVVVGPSLETLRLLNQQRQRKMN